MRLIFLIIMMFLCHSAKTSVLVLLNYNVLFSRHKGKTALEMASKKSNLRALLEEHTGNSEPTHVNGISNGSVSPLLERCSLSNRGKPLCRPKVECPRREVKYF